MLERMADALGDSAAKRVKMIYLHDTPHGFISFDNRITEFKKVCEKMVLEVRLLWDKVSNEDSTKGSGVLDQPPEFPADDIV